MKINTSMASTATSEQASTGSTSQEPTPHPSSRAAPQWSNPDPHAPLKAQTKDIVGKENIFQILRESKSLATKKSVEMNPVAAGADEFISLENDDNDDEDNTGGFIGFASGDDSDGVDENNNDAFISSGGRQLIVQPLTVAEAVIIAQRNMLASPLLRLPAELRVEISKYVFKQSIPIRYNQVYWGCPYSTTVLDMTSPDYFPIHHRYKYSDHWSALAMACRQLYSENGTLAWQMQDFQTLVSALPIYIDRMPEVARNIVTSIEITTEAGRRVLDWSPFACLKRLPALEKIKLIEGIVRDTEISPHNVAPFRKAIELIGFLVGKEIKAVAMMNPGNGWEISLQ